jgi:hypothetical protein
MNLAASVIQKAWRSCTSKCEECGWTVLNRHMCNGYCDYCTELYIKNLAATKIQNAWKAFANYNCSWCKVPVAYRTWCFFQGHCESCEDERLEMVDSLAEKCHDCGINVDECHCDCNDEYCDCQEDRRCSPVPDYIPEKRKGVSGAGAECDRDDEKDLWWDNWLEEQRLQLVV